MWRETLSRVRSSGKQRLELLSFCNHFFAFCRIHRPEIFTGPQDHWQDAHIADRAKPGHIIRQRKIDRPLDDALLVERLVPGRGGVFALAPGRFGDGLDDHRADVALAADANQFFGVFAVIGIAHLDEVEREQDAVEVETAQGFEIYRRGIDPMTGDANIFEQTLLAGFEESLHRAAPGKDGVQLLHCSYSMELIQVEGFGLQALQRGAQFLPCAFLGALHRLAAQENLIADARQPRTNADFGLTVGWSDVEVVDARLQDLLEDFVGVSL